MCSTHPKDVSSASEWRVHRDDLYEEFLMYVNVQGQDNAWQRSYESIPDKDYALLKSWGYVPEHASYRTAIAFLESL